MTKQTTHSGQIVVILLLVVVVTLALGLSIINRSILEISTSNKTEDSARSFSAAEAAIEKAIKASTDASITSRELVLNNFDNQTNANSNWDIQIPGSGKALEYPPFGKESFAQFWLADPNTLAKSYDGDNFELFFGLNRDYTIDPDNQPAIEVHVVTKKGANFESKKFYYDAYATAPLSGRNSNGFEGCQNRGNQTPQILTNNNTAPSIFYCRVTVNYRSIADHSNLFPILVRVRLLYTSGSHPVALKPTVGSLPYQAVIFNSTGTSGNTRRDLQVFQQRYVAPYLFDYVLFSASEIKK